MTEYQMGVVESRFADMIWQQEPVSSTALCKQCEVEFSWKKSTTYTVLKRLCDKGIFQNQKGTVTSLISRQQFYSAQSEKYVEENFNGSLPAFLAAFTSRKRLSQQDVEELRRLVDAHEEDT